LNSQLTYVGPQPLPQPYKDIGQLHSQYSLWTQFFSLSALLTVRN